MSMFLQHLIRSFSCHCSSKHQYYNINQQHSDYYNDPNILNQEKPQNNNPYWAQAESVDDGVYY